jgi:guanylate kinase
MSHNTIDFNILKPRPLLIIISGPSGVGKDAVVRELIRHDPRLDFAVTTTDRAPRATEVHGVDYYFISTDEFKRLVAHGEFIEHSEVYGQLKGVSRKEVKEKWAQGKDVILRVDYQGAAKFKALIPQVLTIFLLPTSEQELLQRLKDRGTENPDTIIHRMATTRVEMDNLSAFEYLVYNPQGKMDEAVAEIQAIISAEHHRRNQRQIDI